MHAGYPWLPEPQPKDLATAAVSEAAQAAASSAEGRASGRASGALSPPLATSSAGVHAEESARHRVKVSGGAEERQLQQGPVHGSNVNQGLRATFTSGGPSGTATQAVADSPVPYAPPSAGRGSELGVSTSEPTSHGAESMHPPAFTPSQKQSRAVTPMPGAQVTPRHNIRHASVSVCVCVCVSVCVTHLAAEPHDNLQATHEMCQAYVCSCNAIVTSPLKCSRTETLNPTGTGQLPRHSCSGHSQELAALYDQSTTATAAKGYKHNKLFPI